tara:strand:+ start:59 stop:505 length:447 start_codon:yes stop_codon:yes gene_type:complete
MDIRSFFDGGLGRGINESTKRITELENLLRIEKLKIVNHNFAQKIINKLDILKEEYGEELFVNVINEYMDYEFYEEETKEEEWIMKHKPDPNRKYKHGQKGVACKIANGKERWSFTGYSYPSGKKVYVSVDSKNQACAYAKKVWGDYR